MKQTLYNIFLSDQSEETLMRVLYTLFTILSIILLFNLLFLW